jgi:hypothetical protein
MPKLLTILLCLLFLLLGGRASAECTGNPMTTNEALARFPAGHFAVQLGTYQSWSWERYCTKQTGCSPWLHIADNPNRYPNVYYPYTSPDVRRFFPVPSGESFLQITSSGKVELFLSSRRNTPGSFVDDSFHCLYVDSKVLQCNGELGAQPRYDMEELGSIPPERLERFRASLPLSRLIGKITSSCFVLTHQSSYFIQEGVQWREVYYVFEQKF